MSFSNINTKNIPILYMFTSSILGKYFNLYVEKLSGNPSILFTCVDLTNINSCHKTKQLFNICFMVCRKSNQIQNYNIIGFEPRSLFQTFQQQPKKALFVYKTTTWIGHKCIQHWFLFYTFMNSLFKILYLKCLTFSMFLMSGSKSIRCWTHGGKWWLLKVDSCSTFYVFPLN